MTPADPIAEESLVLSLSFDESGDAALDEAGAMTLELRGRARPAERSPGVHGQALVLDGDTWLERPLPLEE